MRLSAYFPALSGVNVDSIRSSSRGSPASDRTASTGPGIVRALPVRIGAPAAIEGHLDSRGSHLLVRPAFATARCCRLQTYDGVPASPASNMPFPSRSTPAVIFNRQPEQYETCRLAGHEMRVVSPFAAVRSICPIQAVAHVLRAVHFCRIENPVAIVVDAGVHLDAAAGTDGCRRLRNTPWSPHAIAASSSPPASGSASPPPEQAGKERSMNQDRQYHSCTFLHIAPLPSTCTLPKFSPGSSACHPARQ